MILETALLFVATYGLAVAVAYWQGRRDERAARRRRGLLAAEGLLVRKRSHNFRG